MTGKESKIISKHNDIEALVLQRRQQEGVKPVMLVAPAAGFDDRSIDLRILELRPGGQSKNHRETKEHIMYFLKGKGYAMIEGKKYEWQEGDALFIPSWAWHQIWNTSPDQYARYLSATNAPLVRSLGIDNTEFEKE